MNVKEWLERKGSTYFPVSASNFVQTTNLDNVESFPFRIQRESERGERDISRLVSMLGASGAWA